MLSRLLACGAGISTGTALVLAVLVAGSGSVQTSAKVESGFKAAWGGSIAPPGATSATGTALAAPDPAAPPGLDLQQGPLARQCPLATVEAPWLTVAPLPEPPKLPEAPRSLEARIAFWKKVWGELGDHQTLLVDDRRPSVVHASVDCRDLYATGNSNAKEDCGARVTTARRAVQNKLKDKRAALRALHDKKLARDARQHVIGVQGRKDALDRARERARPQLAHAEALFAEQGVPRLYARAAIVESLWRPEALSRSGAAGAFQFMPKTGREWLQVVDGAVDERLDPLRSSWAAARYLKHIHNDFQSWPLVLTAYNTGPARMKRVMKERHTKDLGVIADRGTLGEYGFDGQNYYAQIVAIARLTRDDEFPLTVETGRTLEVTQDMSFADVVACTQTSPVLLARSNPALSSAVTEGKLAVPKGYVVQLPSEVTLTAMR